MANLVIVAIPAEDDYIWQLSSEQKPHMTICFLGDVVGKPVMKISDFLEHAVNILEFGPFGLEVDYRGTLGPDQADVLFFRKGWSLRRVAEFRDQILKDNNIRAAYESAPQHDLYPDGWTPHLTMGYPGAPAREDKRDFPGTRWIEFDKIALWYGNYEGTEWRLTYDNYDLAEVAMSAQAGREFISHHGVKGMKWGQRKGRTPAPVSAQAMSIVKNPKNTKTKIKAVGGHNHPATADAIKAAVSAQKLKKSGHHALTNQELQDLASRLNLEQQVSSLISKRPKSATQQVISKALQDPAKTVQATGKAAGEVNKLLNRSRR